MLVHLRNGSVQKMIFQVPRTEWCGVQARLLCTYHHRSWPDHLDARVVVVVVVGWLLTVPATCERLSGTDLFRQ